MKEKKIDNYQEDAECLQRPKSFDFNEVCDYVADEREQEQYNVTLNHDDFYCKYCRKQYMEPKVLPCLHTFCTKCLNELVNTTSQGMYSIRFIDNITDNR